MQSNTKDRKFLILSLPMTLLRRGLLLFSEETARFQGDIG